MTTDQTLNAFNRVSKWRYFIGIIQKKDADADAGLGPES